MHQIRNDAMSFLKERWHIGITGTSDAAYLLGINSNTFATRVKRGQALVLREAGGGQRATLTLTGYHLVYNLISDRLLRYGFPVEHNETTMAMYPYSYAEWVRENVLSEPHLTSAVVRFRKDDNGEVLATCLKDGAGEDWTEDAAVYIPIGIMTVRLAQRLFVRAAENRREHITRGLAVALSDEMPGNGS